MLAGYTYRVGVEYRIEIRSENNGLTLLSAHIQTNPAAPCLARHWCKDWRTFVQIWTNSFQVHTKTGIVLIYVNNTALLIFLKARFSHFGLFLFHYGWPYAQSSPAAATSLHNHKPREKRKSSQPASFSEKLTSDFSHSVTFWPLRMAWHP